jgi:alkylation response protein AidB-like acyl-CoA dehydrogenase
VSAQSALTTALDLPAISAFADRVRGEVHERDARAEYPADLVAEMRSLGFFGACAGDLREYALALEELGRAWLSLVPIANAHSSSVWSLKHHGTDEQRARWLPVLVSGARTACLGLTEPGGGTDLAAVASTAERDGDGWVLHLGKTLITHADNSDHMLVLVRTSAPDRGPSSGLSLFLIDRDDYVVERRLPKLGTISVETCQVRAEGVRVADDRLIGGVPGRGFAQAMDALEVGRIAVAAAAVGVARSAMWAAIERVREREAFGAPLAEQPLVQQRIAAMTMKIAAAKGLTQLACERKAAGGRHDTETSAAKAVATEAAMHASLTAMELGGGLGYTEDLDFARHLRDAALFLAGEGANSVLEGLIGARMVHAEPDLHWI